MLVYISGFRKFALTINWKTPEKFNDVAQGILNTCWNSWYQKLSRVTFIKVDRQDTYDARTTLAAITYEVMRKYNEEDLGFKHTIRKDAPSSGVYDDPNMRWRWITKEIELVFYLIKEDRFETNEDRVQNGLDLYAKYFLGLWW